MLALRQLCTLHSVPHGRVPVRQVAFCQAVRFMFHAVLHMLVLGVGAAQVGYLSGTLRFSHVVRFMFHAVLFMCFVLYLSCLLGVSSAQVEYLSESGTLHSVTLYILYVPCCGFHACARRQLSSGSHVRYAALFHAVHFMLVLGVGSAQVRLDVIYAVIDPVVARTQPFAAG